MMAGMRASIVLTLSFFVCAWADGAVLEDGGCIRGKAFEGNRTEERYFEIMEELSSSSQPFSLPGDFLFPTREDIDELKAALPGRVFARGELLLETWNVVTRPEPLVVIQVADVDDIVAGIAFARAHNLRVAAFSTGHHLDSRHLVDNSIVIDTSGLRDVVVDEAARTVTVGPGLSLDLINDAVDKATNGRLIALQGSYPGVGPYGWSTSGGHGRLTRLYGLGADALIGADIVTANGTALRLSENGEEHQELLRALRGAGGGGAFGIAHRLTFRLYEDPGPSMSFDGIVRASAKSAQVLNDFLLNAPDSAGGYFIFDDVGITGRPDGIITAFCSGNMTECALLLEQFETDIAKQCLIGCAISTFDSYHDVFRNQAAGLENLAILQGESQESSYAASIGVNVSNLEAGALEALAKYVRKFDPSLFPGSTGIRCTYNGVLGGESSRQDVSGCLTAIAPAARNSVVQLTCQLKILRGDDANGKAAEAWKEFYETEMAPYTTEGWAYWNEPPHQLDDWQAKYWGGRENYLRLLETKLEYDGDNFLTCHHCVGSEFRSFYDGQYCEDDCASCTNVAEKGMCSVIEAF